MGALVAALAIPATLYFRAPAPERIVTRLEIVPPPNLDGSSMALSPDGRRLALVATSGRTPELWVRSFDEPSIRILAGADGAAYPFWSPDSRSIGFFASGKLRRIDIGTGVIQTLADAPNARGGAWNNDGVIVFAANNTEGLVRVPATGGVPMVVTRLSEGQIFYAAPDNRTIMAVRIAIGADGRSLSSDAPSRPHNLP
jgi:eukaryotic-like serine/threonine-protein kinase